MAHIVIHTHESSPGWLLKLTQANHLQPCGRPGGGRDRDRAGESRRARASSSSFARSYASDFSPGDADGRRGGATGALSPPTTHGVHLAPSRLRAPNLSCHLQLIHSRRHEHSHAATAWYWWWQPIRAVAVRPSSPCQTASSCRSVRAQRSFESPTRCRKVVGPLRRGAC